MANDQNDAPLRLKAKHSLAIRWFHWINFPVLFVMIWSGLLIYWANAVYTVSLGGHTLFRVLPQDLLTHLGFQFKLAKGMSWHFLFMWVFAINGALYALFTALSGQWRQIVPNRGSLREAVHVVLHDLRLRKEPPPVRKFNGAQQIAYTAIVLMGLGSLLTGLAIYKPTQLSWLAALFGGYGAARFLHFWLTMGFLAFFVVHVLQVARAGWNNFRSMITGYELAPEPEVTP
jgi:thiosulfate reductase cytochrome b subunit